MPTSRLSGRCARRTRWSPRRRRYRRRRRRSPRRRSPRRRIMRRGSRVRTITVAFVLLSPAVVAAQGNGHGHAYGLNKNQGSAPSAASAPVVTPAGTAVARHFGSWLDDASRLPQGQAALSFGFGYWRTPSYREFDAPSVDGSLGLTRRV